LVVTTLHATCIAIGGRAILLTGRSGAGKSDLALRLIDRGALLVSDDGTILTSRDGRLYASAPATIAGRIEVRGLGILETPTIAEAPVALCIALDQPVPRMPDEILPTQVIEGIALPLLALDPFENSTPVKVEKALMRYGLNP
jgi:serine kinase of HPr protein (carbohydrate metabolism regulator)